MRNRTNTVLFVVAAVLFVACIALLWYMKGLDTDRDNRLKQYEEAKARMKDRIEELDLELANRNYRLDTLGSAYALLLRADSELVDTELVVIEQHQQIRHALSSATADSVRRYIVGQVARYRHLHGLPDPTDGPGGQSRLQP